MIKAFNNFMNGLCRGWLREHGHVVLQPGFRGIVIGAGYAVIKYGTIDGGAEWAVSTSAGSQVIAVNHSFVDSSKKDAK